ncbi:MAG: hypothetical protein JWN68_2738 [Nocardioides sp.]|uniref:putative Ig domain-containing protein n=1 Tax=Nocardioides sp. TaxID=35761 RepID=UPI0026027C9D|nr:putative Ig domain-containing protein [Nocardioides sp.]MCW2834785.1 hypothetical protein [Nocardioides sp.]
MLRRLVLCVTISVIGLPVLTQPAAHADGPVPLVSQIANEPVSVSATEFRRHLFVAADAARLSDPSNTSDLLAERVLQHMCALDPQIDPVAAAEAVEGLRAAAESVTGPAFDSRISRTMVLFQRAAAADQGPVAATLQRATTELIALTAQQITSVAASTHAENALGTTGDTESRLLASSTFTPTAVLLDSATLADDSMSFAVARDLVWQDLADVSISASTPALLADAPRLKNNADVQALAALRDQSGNLETTGGVIAGTPTNPAPHTIGAAMAGLDNALGTTREAAAASTGATPMDPAVAAQAVEEARDSQTTLALQTGFLTGGTSASKDIVDQVGAAAVQVTLLAMSFNEFAGGSIGRAALSGNVLGVVMTLLPAVLDAAGVFGPSAEDLLFAQLDNISQQMADFQNSVNAQFALVFESLGQVSAQLTDISQKLDRAVIDIEQARVQIGQMYDSLSRLQGSLDAVQNNILEALSNGTNSQLRQVISSALGYEQRNDTPLPLNEFNNAAAYLHTFATVTARHSPELNTDFPSFDLQNDANQLSTGIASNVHFLDQVPAQRGWRSGRLSGLTGDAPQLANVDDFVLAARAYAQLMLENPRYVSAGYRRWLSDIQLLGAPLANLTSAISTSDTAEGTHSTLLNRLVCARTMAAFAPTTSPACQAQTEDTTPVDTLVNQALGQLTGTVPGFDGPGNPTPSSPLTTTGATTFNPFVNSSSDGSDLSALWRLIPGRETVSQCVAPTGETAGTLAAMTRPDSLTPNNHGVPQVFQWADRMGLGKLDVCFKTTVRTTTVSACKFREDQWMVVNRLTAGECVDTFWDPGAFSANVFGVVTSVTYKYDDTAFVWTFTPAASPSAPVYVQSVVRRGAANGAALTARALRVLPRGGYSQDTTHSYISDVTLIDGGSTTSRNLYELTNVVGAPMYAGSTTAAQVRLAWGEATTATEGVRSYQGHSGTISAGDQLDQAITGLDPKLAATKVILDQAAVSAKAAIDDTLVDLQGDVYRGLLRGSQTTGNTSSGPLHDALIRLDGANAMLSSFLDLGASAALRERDLTSLPGGLVGSKALVDAIKAELAKTVAGETGTGPDELVTDILDAEALDELDGLLPSPTVLPAGVAASSLQSIVGPVHPALQSTNDQMTLTAIALGAPPSVTPPPTTPPTTPPPSPSPAPSPTPTPTPTPMPAPPVAAPVAFINGWVSGARVTRRYEERVRATGGTGTYTWSRRGKLPRGVKGKPTKSGGAYVIEGRPVMTGVFKFTLTATDSDGAKTTRRFRIRVRPR